MKYFAYLTQAGEGCDYTIACGKKMVALEAQSMPQAEEEMEFLMRLEYYDETALESAKILEVSDLVDIDVDAIYNKIEEEYINKKEAADLIDRRNEYERLKKEFGE